MGATAGGRALGGVLAVAAALWLAACSDDPGSAEPAPTVGDVVGDSSSMGAPTSAPTVPDTGAVEQVPFADDGVMSATVADLMAAVEASWLGPNRLTDCALAIVYDERWGEEMATVARVARYESTTCPPAGDGSVTYLVFKDGELLSQIVRTSAVLDDSSVTAESDAAFDEFTNDYFGTAGLCVFLDIAVVERTDDAGGCQVP